MKNEDKQEWIKIKYHSSIHENLKIFAEYCVGKQQSTIMKKCRSLWDHLFPEIELTSDLNYVKEERDRLRKAIHTIRTGKFSGSKGDKTFIYSLSDVSRISYNKTELITTFKDGTQSSFELPSFDYLKDCFLDNNNAFL